MWQRLALITTLCIATLAHGHDSGTPYAEWMMNLKQPGKSVSCCGEADQYFVKDYRPSETPGIAFTARVIAKYNWLPDFDIDVPSSTVMWNQSNPTGRGVIFIQINEHDSRRVLCFVPGTGT